MLIALCHCSLIRATGTADNRGTATVIPASKVVTAATAAVDKTRGRMRGVTTNRVTVRVSRHPLPRVRLPPARRAVTLNKARRPSRGTEHRQPVTIKDMDSSR